MNKLNTPTHHVELLLLVLLLALLEGAQGLRRVVAARIVAAKANVNARRSAACFSNHLYLLSNTIETAATKFHFHFHSTHSPAAVVLDGRDGVRLGTHDLRRRGGGTHVHGRVIPLLLLLLLLEVGLALAEAGAGVDLRRLRGIAQISVAGACVGLVERRSGEVEVCGVSEV